MEKYTLEIEQKRNLEGIVYSNNRVNFLLLTSKTGFFYEASSIEIEYSLYWWGRGGKLGFRSNLK